MGGNMGNAVQKAKQGVILREPAMQALLEECARVLDAKGADYTVGQGHLDRVRNFRGAAIDLGLPMRQVWAVYAHKHWTAVMKHARDGQVESEPIEGRLVDMINYLLLYKLIADEGALQGGE
jgi:hypothetical protein